MRDFYVFMIREQIRPVEVGFQIGALDSALSQSNRAGGDSGQLESELKASIWKENFQAGLKKWFLPYHEASS